MTIRFSLGEIGGWVNRLGGKNEGDCAKCLIPWA